MTDEDVLDRILKNAALVLDVAERESDAPIGFDRTGVVWLDGFIQGQHKAGVDDKRDALINTLGSFLGECIVESYGGSWEITDYGWAIQFDVENAVFPFAKVEKHLSNGREDSVLAFFESIPMLMPREHSGSDSH